MTLNEFMKTWMAHRGVVHVMESEWEDPVWDSIDAGITDAVEIFNNIHGSPLFSLWETDVQYLPCGYMTDKWANIKVEKFFIIKDGIIVLVNNRAEDETDGQ